MGNEDQEKIINRLDVLISIALKATMKDRSMIDKVEILKNLGLGYKEIASILETSPNSISVMFAKINKKNG